MLKRFLPLLFVVAVTMATVIGFLVLRKPAPATGNEAPDSGVAQFRVASEADYLQMLEALGTSPEEIEAWARSRGFPPATFTAVAGAPLEQPYRTYDEATLRGLAESGDLWAMQYLAASIVHERPLEAATWYRAAAVRGSVYAERELGSLYHDLDRALEGGRTDRWDATTLEAVEALAKAEMPLEASALAWLLAGETEAVLPPGSLALSLASFHGPEETLQEACARAHGLLADLASQRAGAGIPPPSREPPPFSVELPPEETAGYCAPDMLPRPDYSGCQTVRLVSDTGQLNARRCPAAD